MTGIMCTTMGAGFGSGSTTIAITVGYYTDYTVDYYGLGHVPYDLANYGSASPTTVSTFGGATLYSCNWQQDSYYGTQLVYLNVSGDQTSKTWISMTINGVTYNKSAAYTPSGSYVAANDYTLWVWSGYAGNPFPYPGTVNVVFA